MKLAAEQGDVNAQNNLGVMYFQGQGVPQDYKEAAKWLRLAAVKGNKTAQKNLDAAMYEVKKLERAEKAKRERLAQQKLAAEKAEKERQERQAREKAFEPGLLAMEKSRFLACDAFIVNLRAQTIFFDGTYNEPLLMKELRLYNSIREKRIEKGEITKQEFSLAGGKLNIELKKKYGSDNLKKLTYLDQETVECGGESKQIAAKQLSPKEKGFALLMLAKKCKNSALRIRGVLVSHFSASMDFFEIGDYQSSIDISRRLLSLGREYGESNCHE